jgi:hypothetical protein
MLMIGSEAMSNGIDTHSEQEEDRYIVACPSLIRYAWTSGFQPPLASLTGIDRSCTRHGKGERGFCQNPLRSSGGGTAILTEVKSKLLQPACNDLVMLEAESEWVDVVHCN